MKKALGITVLGVIVAVSVWLLDVRVVGMTLLNATLKLTDAVDVTKNIRYGNDSWQQLDVYPAASKEAKAPVVVFIHGGAWYWGNKDLYYFAADAFVRLGYVVVVPDYVKYPDGRFPTFIEDGAKALAWTKSNISQFGGDANRIFLSGHSAGAHTGALLATDASYLAQVGLTPKDIKAFAGIAGPYNFTPKWHQYIETFGSDNFERMKASSHVSGDEPPIVLIHARGDTAVGQFKQDTMFEDLSARQQVVQKILYGEEVGHISIMMKLHPWFADDVDVSHDINAFFLSNM